MIRAEDEGGLSNTATVNIIVSDINDKNPEFVDLPYDFVVREGEAGSLVGTVRAVDADEGSNALVTYSLPSDVPFAVNSTSGIITTSTALDYETQKVGYVFRETSPYRYVRLIRQYYANISCNRITT